MIIMVKFCILTDSGADLTNEMIKKYNFKIVPFSVVLSDTDEVLKERIEISNEDYYNRVLTAKNHPTTAHPNPHEMLTIFKELENEGYQEIFYITMAASITGTFSTAHLAKKIFEKEGGKANITIYDSFQATIAIGIQALKAYQLLNGGKSIEETIQALDYFKLKELKSALTVKTLRYLMKGGRVSRWKYAVGSILGVIPTLEGTYEGKLEAFGSARSYKDAITKVVDRAYDEIKDKEDLAVYISSGMAEDGVTIAKSYIKEKYPDIKFMDSLQIGSAIFTHTGPGIVAIIMFKYFDH